VKERSCGCGCHRQIPTLLLSISCFFSSSSRAKRRPRPLNGDPGRSVGRIQTGPASVLDDEPGRLVGRSQTGRPSLVHGWMDGWSWPVGSSLAYRQDFFFCFVHGWAWTVGDSVTYKQAFVHGWDRMVRYIKDRASSFMDELAAFMQMNV
jgi:hypothetical protein